AIRIVEYQDMTVARARIGVAFDRRRDWNRHGPGIAFTAVGGEIDRDRRLLRANDQVWNTDRRALILARPEVRMDANAAADEIDHCRGIGIHGRGRNIGVTETVGGKRHEASATRALADRPAATVRRLR